MASLDYAHVVEMIERQTSRTPILRAASFVMLLDALYALEYENQWQNDGDELSIAEWDTVDDWVSGAKHDLLSEYEPGTPPGGGRIMSVAHLQYQVALGTHGGGIASKAWTQRLINVEVKDADNIVTLSSNKFTPIEGDYVLFGFFSQLAGDNRKLRVWNSTTSTLINYNASQRILTGGAPGVIVAAFSANGTDEYEIDDYAITAKTSSALGYKMSYPGGSYEVYADIYLEKITNDE